ncbi:glutamine amidotransferase-like class 1 domain-containing protein 3, mitochondrial isoform X1 [Eubalaena glacialis]|uniref:glutamine amidotransferase-like class 1 domain-containing protein 3, mitochondrial isoform X1 n=1 Tax=Eubalaena glacialis TaxID=27606 RepID=UPI002A5B10D3|nr:glutamine amidotransferase-like class 1 domain-containing protein 3, mitochondrial isoform X1 [Eubalaena glacialis]
MSSRRMAAIRALVASRLALTPAFAPRPGLRPLPFGGPAPSPRAALHASAPRPVARVAVVLSGCGVYDGTELHEASSILVHLSRAGAEVQIFAPDIPQMHVIDHTKGQPSEGETRNVLTESARIARGKITDLAKLSAANHDAAVFPGGFGAAKNLLSRRARDAPGARGRGIDHVNKAEEARDGAPGREAWPLKFDGSEFAFQRDGTGVSPLTGRETIPDAPAVLLWSTFAVDGGDCKVNKDVERVLKEFHQAGKPIGLCCIAPVLAAKVLRSVEVTVGHEQEEGGKWPHAGTAQVIKALGAKHCVTGVTEAHVDQRNKVVTTPAFMCDAAFHHVHDGLGAMVRKVLELASK